MDPFFYTDFSISDSLKTVRKSVLIYDTIIIPILGFYGQFAPLVQPYSCAESPLWLGKAFLCLALPKEHEFWTVVESDHHWDTIDLQTKVRNEFLNGPGLAFFNHQLSGETILRTGKVLKHHGDIHGMWNYSKLCYNTKFPGEAAPCDTVESQQYVLKDTTTGQIERANITFWAGHENDILYRKQIFNYYLDKEKHWAHQICLADFTVPYGVIRIDKLNLFRKPISLTLGSYGFPG